MALGNGTRIALAALAAIGLFGGIVALVPMRGAAPEGEAAALATLERPDAEAAIAEAEGAEEPLVEETAETAAELLRFDTVRVEPDGSGLVAGRAEPGATVSILAAGEVMGEALADADGNFVAFLDLPPSDQPRELSLRAGLVDSAATVILGPTPSTAAGDATGEAADASASAEEETALAGGTLVARGSDGVAASGAEEESSGTVAAGEDSAADAASEPGADRVTDEGVEMAALDPADGAGPAPAAEPGSAGLEATSGDAMADAGEAGATPVDGGPAAEGAAVASGSPLPLADVDVGTALDGSNVAPSGGAGPALAPDGLVEPATQATGSPTGASEAPVDGVAEAPATAGSLDGDQDAAVAIQDALPTAPVPTGEAPEDVATPDVPASGAAVSEATATPPPGEAAGSSLDATASVVAESDGPDELSAPPSGSLAATPDGLAAGGEGAAPGALPAGAGEADPDLAAAPPVASAEMPVLASPATDAPGQAPILVSDAAGVRLLQPALPAGADPEVLATVALDAITYDGDGEVSLAGRGSGGGSVRVYLDNAVVAEAAIGADGQWALDLAGTPPGVYALRVDQVDADGTVVSRIETPFQREERGTLAAAMADAQEAGQTIAVRTVQPGNTLWAIARDRYGEPLMYVQVFEMNRDRIRDPDLIYPGQVFVLPATDGR